MCGAVEVLHHWFVLYWQTTLGLGFAFLGHRVPLVGVTRNLLDIPISSSPRLHALCVLCYRRCVSVFNLLVHRFGSCYSEMIGCEAQWVVITNLMPF